MNRAELDHMLHASRPPDLLEPAHRRQLEQELRRRIRQSDHPTVTPWSMQAYLAGAAAALVLLFVALQNQPVRTGSHPLEVLQRPIVPSHSGSSIPAKVVLPRIDRLVCAPVDFSLVNRNLPD